MRKLMILLALLAAAGLAEQPAIAIVDFEAVNCDVGIAKAVGEIMRTEIIATGRFRVIERAQLARVMEEHAFQLSGLVDARTVAEFGRLVGADYVAVGSVSRLAGTYTVAVRYIDVETAEASLGRTETADGEGMLPDVCRRLAAALTGLPYSGSSTGDYGYSSVSTGAGRIAFHSDRDGEFECYIMNADGSDVTQLTFRGGCCPAWSPDGRRIAFQSVRNSDYYEIFVVNIDGSNLNQITDYYYSDRYPSWSPDGNYIAYSSFLGDDCEIIVVEVDSWKQIWRTKNLRTDNGKYMNEFNSDWSPDGKLIAFDSDRDGIDIYVMDTNGKNERRLTYRGGRHPAWSPDSKRIAFTMNDNIFVMDADGSNQRQLTTQGGEYPSWNPDGRYIAFDSDRDGDWEIFVMDSDGSNQTQLTNNDCVDGFPAWCPVE